MNRVIILTGNHLCYNPRVVKEATTLANAGYQVKVLGAWTNRELKRRDIEMRGSLPFVFQTVMDTTESGPRRLCARIGRKMGLAIHGVTGIENEYQLGYARRALSRVAVGEPADLWIAHSEAAMAVAADLARTGGRAGIDFEDWFSEDLMPDARKGRPVNLLRSLEGKLLRDGVHATCPSRAMSDALSNDFGCFPPAVVYNAFPWADRRALDGRKLDRQDLTVRSIHWFSQTLGPGRGLEDLLSALPLLQHDVEVHLRGNPSNGLASWLEVRTPKRWLKRIVLHHPVSPAELLSRIAEHDIGFAGETTNIRSRDLTVTNKILYYLLAGLAVAASDTAGQRDVALQAPGAVFLYRCGDASALAAALDRLLGSSAALERAKAAALAAAEQTFCWERQENVLLDSVARALSSPERTLMRNRAAAAAR
jgi:glycosyltransferase involved in cell wall biosynthesis